MKTSAKYHACNHRVIGEKTFKTKLVGPGKLPGLSRKGPQGSRTEKSVFTGSGATLLSGLQVERLWATHPGQTFRSSGLQRQCVTVSGYYKLYNCNLLKLKIRQSNDRLSHVKCRHFIAVFTGPYSNGTAFRVWCLIFLNNPLTSDNEMNEKLREH